MPRATCSPNPEHFSAISSLTEPRRTSLLCDRSPDVKLPHLPESELNKGQDTILELRDFRRCTAGNCRSQVGSINRLQYASMPSIHFLVSGAPLNPPSRRRRIPAVDCSILVAFWNQNPKPQASAQTNSHMVSVLGLSRGIVREPKNLRYGERRVSRRGK